MAKLKTAKNLLQKRDEYSRYYGDFRGVDFSSDHTQVHDQRLAYSVNMFKDYQSGQGKAIETVPGFRRKADFFDPELYEGTDFTVYGIHPMNFTDSEGHDTIVHCGTELYLWARGSTHNIRARDIVILKDGKPTESEDVFEYETGISGIVAVYDREGNSFPINTFTDEGKIYTSAQDGSSVIVEHIEKSAKELYGGMVGHQSRSFFVMNDMYIIDGENFLRVRKDDDGSAKVENAAYVETAYVPTTYIDLLPTLTAEDIKGRKYQHMNFLSNRFVNTFIADGETKEFHLLDKFDNIVSVKVYDVEYSLASAGAIGNGQYRVNKDNNSIEFGEAIKKPEDNGLPAGTAGIVITAAVQYNEEFTSLAKQITGCTLYALFDGRVFFSGNPLSPNTLYWCSLNPDTALPDVSYWGMYDHIQVGQEDNAPITGLVPVANTLMVLKGDSKSDGSVYYVTPEATGDKLYPVTYVKQSGLNGIGCLGASCNFLDDPVFVSRLGLEGVGQLSTRLERAIEHRSSLVDAKLCNEDLKTAKLVEWDGYLVLLVNGRIYLADSRQRYTHETGVMQYEWYYLEDIGVYDNMKEEYKYSSYSIFADGLEGDINDESVKVCLNTEKSGFVVPSSCNVVEATVAGRKYYVVRDGDMAYLVEPTGGMITTKESKYYPAVTIESIDGNLFFGTGNGVVCSFNFDMRGVDGSIDPKWYTFDGRAILCGVATKMDNCGIPHLVKNTVKKSTVIKTKTYQTSAAKIKVRTNNKPYEQIARINSTIFSFENMDFSDFSFLTTEQSLFAIREKEKRWVEKQYYIYSDEIGKPFALFYIAFRYNVAGRYKE